MRALVLLLAMTIPAKADSVRAYMLQQRLTGQAVDGTTAARVFGGRKALPGAWPAQVALVGRIPAGPDQPTELFYQFCGGSVIAPDWVLTAAHCVFEADGRQTQPGDILVQSGSTLVNAGDRTAVAAIFAHPAYDAEVTDNDVALLKLATPVTVPAVPLPAPMRPRPWARVWSSAGGSWRMPDCPMT